MKNNLTTTQKNLLYSAALLVIAGSGAAVPLHAIKFISTSQLLWLVHPVLTATIFTKGKTISEKIGHSLAGFGMSFVAVILGIGIGIIINPEAYESSTSTQNSYESSTSASIDIPQVDQ